MGIMPNATYENTVICKLRKQLREELSLFEVLQYLFIFCQVIERRLSEVMAWSLQQSSIQNLALNLLSR